MKKILLFAAGMLFTIQTYAQKTDFGVTAGYLNINAASTSGIYDESENASGFYVGFLADIPLSEAFYLQPSVNYGNAEEANLLSIPVMLKYYIADSGFNVLAGPQANIILDERPGTVKALGIDLGFGAGYDINENFFLQAKYFLELTNRFKDDIMGLPEGVEFDYNVNTLFIGVGYKF